MCTFLAMRVWILVPVMFIFNWMYRRFNQDICDTKIDLLCHVSSRKMLLPTLTPTAGFQTTKRPVHWMEGCILHRIQVIACWELSVKQLRAAAAGTGVIHIRKFLRTRETFEKPQPFVAMGMLLQNAVRSLTYSFGIIVSLRMNVVSVRMYRQKSASKYSFGISFPVCDIFTCWQINTTSSYSHCFILHFPFAFIHGYLYVWLILRRLMPSQ